jgi:rhomboid protease GluP
LIASAGCAEEASSVEILETDPTPIRPEHNLPLLASLMSVKPPKGVRIAPELPDRMLQAAGRAYLRLEEGEVILGLAGRSDSIPPMIDCVLTTRGVHYVHKRIKGSGDGINPALRGGLVAYAELPATMRAGGSFVPRIDFTDDLGRIAFQSGSAARNFVLDFLKNARSLVADDASAQALSPTTHPELQTRLDDAARISRQVLEAQAHAKVFASRFLATKRAVVTPAIIAACSIVFVLMAINGISPLEPSVEGLLAWGASYGPMVLVDHQYWRMLTYMFLHIGFFHILLNMFALATSGPVVERMFGHFGFAALYLLSGIGGSIASLWYHPLLVSAGASGAIFGVYGGLIGLLAARRNEAPLSVLKPMAKGLAAFLGYNLIFGLFVPNIDMAAHVGGLVVGFVCGLVLAFSSKAASSFRPLAQGVAVVGLSALLGALALIGTNLGRTRLTTDPEYAKRNAAPEFNRFMEAVIPLMQDFDEIQNERQRLLVDQDISKDEVRQLESLARRSEDMQAKIGSIATENPDLDAMKQVILSMAKHQKSALDQLAIFGKTRQRSAIEGPNGFVAENDASTKDGERFTALRAEYIRKNGLKVLEK